MSRRKTSKMSKICDDLDGNRSPSELNGSTTQHGDAWMSLYHSLLLKKCRSSISKDTME